MTPSVVEFTAGHRTGLCDCCALIVLFLQLEKINASLQEGKHALEETFQLYFRKSNLEDKIEQNEEDMKIMNELLEKQQEERAQYVVKCPAAEAI